MLGKTVCRKHDYKASEKENSVITVWKRHNDRKANNFYLGACVRIVLWHMIIGTSWSTTEVSYFFLLRGKKRNVPHSGHCKLKPAYEAFIAYSVKPGYPSCVLWIFVLDSNRPLCIHSPSPPLRAVWVEKGSVCSFFMLLHIFLSCQQDWTATFI